MVDHDVLRRSTDRRVHKLLDLALYVGRRTDPSVLRTGDVVYLERTVADEVPNEIAHLAAALGTVQRLTFAVRSRPDLLEQAIDLAAPLR